MPSLSVKTLLFFSVTVGSVINSAMSISCYQCNSTDHKNPFQCGEYMTEDIDIEPQPCDNVYGASFCIKHTGRFEGGLGTKRFCSSLDLGSYCNYIRQPGDVMEYRSCVYTCDSDGCNAGTHQHADITQSLLMVVGAAFTHRLFTHV